MPSASRAAASRPSIEAASASAAVRWSPVVMKRTGLRGGVRRLPPRARGGDVAHRVLRERGDGEARVHADVGGDRRLRRTRADSHSRTRAGARRSRPCRGSRRSPRHPGCERSWGCSPPPRSGRSRRSRRSAGQPPRELVGDGDERRVRALRVLLGLQPHAAARPLRRGRDRVVERLHDEHDHGPASTAAGQVTRAKRSGCRTSAPISLSGRVRRVPSPTSSVNIPLMLSPAAP